MYIQIYPKVLPALVKLSKARASEGIDALRALVSRLSRSLAMRESGSLVPKPPCSHLQSSLVYSHSQPRCISLPWCVAMLMFSRNSYTPALTSA